MNSKLLLTLLVSLALATGCARKAEEKTAGGPPPAMITVTTAQTQDVPVVERAVGEIDSTSAPKVSAEVAGRIIRIHADMGDPVQKGQLLAEIDPADYAADSRRLEAQATSQARLAERYRDLAQKGFISPTKLEEIETQNIVAREQLARARQNLARTRIIAPISGTVENRFIGVGDWIDLGKPVFQLSTSNTLRVRLPFPESAAERIKVGQSVTLTTPTALEQQVSGRIEQLRPMVGSASRAFDAVVMLTRAEGWRPGSSVDAEVVVETHANAVTVPEQSVVLRPAGMVVYIIDNGKAKQRLVKTGVKQAGYIEITEGVRGGETVAVDGAGYLTEGTAVSIKQPGAAQPGAQAK